VNITSVLFEAALRKTIRQTSSKMSVK